ncbi:DNA-directed RNA polymerase subunit beta [bacterium]|nr:DNA-directed RNA polymerase subunit beta [bacterium]MBU1982946.1 DNA-directed RNA polymerase subunit beta [bacterium]
MRDTRKTIQRINFSKIPEVLDLPDLLEVQLRSFDEFLQKDVQLSRRKSQGLQAVFKNIFPIIDNRETHILEFVDYYVEEPKYDEDECRERGVTFQAPLKAKLRLSSRDEASEGGSFDNTIESDVYLGNLPLMTTSGTFIINGAERVIVSQLHRSPGVSFSDDIHPNGKKIFTARIIPFRGSWIEFTTDINDVLYVYIDRRKKFPATTLLRALGHATDSDILRLFDYVEEVPLGRKEAQKEFGRPLTADVVNEATGEVLAQAGAELTEELHDSLHAAKVKSVELLRTKKRDVIYDILRNTLNKDKSTSPDKALEVIYRELRSGEPPDMETARKFLHRLFFDEKRYDLGGVGRYRINSKLNLSVSPETTVLTEDDIVAILKHVLKLRIGKQSPDDIDHLGNRRVRTVGEQLANQFSVALSRMARTIKERMNLRDSESLTPQDLINVRTISSVINTFFGTNQLSQFLDQVNPLTELTHKRRLSALGPGGLTRERAGFEVRDVHYTHYGRLCPIETPEGPNIGLISSLCTFAKINDMGFVETPYRVVKSGRATKQIEYLSADEEDRVAIAQANTPINPRGEFQTDRIKCRHRSDFPVHGPDEIDYMDVAPSQIVSVAAALIPFLEHDDANRALMGSNMQRQAVPLVQPQAPYVGTGMERKAAEDSRTLILAPEDGIVEYVDANRIVFRPRVRPNDGNGGGEEENAPPEALTYKLKKFFRTNQDTCINQRPAVTEGEQIRKGQVLADGCATEKGDLALGRNVLAAFMPWMGYNFEDSIIVSERIVYDDIFTSINIEELELQVRETKRGEEELTREIPNVSEDAVKDLDEIGIIRVGATVRPGDILVGKVTPKGETDLTPEDKLLKAIFGDKAGDVKDASLKAHTGMYGIVINTKLFSRKKKDAKTRREDKKALEELELRFQQNIVSLKRVVAEELYGILRGHKTKEIRDKTLNQVLIPEGVAFTEAALKALDLDAVETRYEWTDNEAVNEQVEQAFEKYHDRLFVAQNEYKNEKYRIQVGDELPPGIVQLVRVYVAQKRKITVGDKMAGRHGNKGVVGKVVPLEDMPFLSDGTPVDIILNPLSVPSRMNIGQIFETTLGWAAHRLGVYFATPVFDGAKIHDLDDWLTRAELPLHGKTYLFDGRTGEPFEQETTVGYIYMMKLSHLVDDKIHARSIGPYSLITQQPLGGKAQFGGQRFGEMEVWALEAYGAAHILQEILTVKSDDVNGRARTYEAIVKGENLPIPGIPESFHVFINELRGLGLDVKLME